MPGMRTGTIKPGRARCSTWRSWSGQTGDAGYGATLGLLVATLFGWGWMQSLSYVGYTRLAEVEVAGAI